MPTIDDIQYAVNVRLGVQAGVERRVGDRCGELAMCKHV
jgi:hypothetical protein